MTPRARSLIEVISATTSPRRANVKSRRLRTRAHFDDIESTLDVSASSAILNAESSRFKVNDDGH